VRLNACKKSTVSWLPANWRCSFCTVSCITSYIYDISFTVFFMSGQLPCFVAFKVLNLRMWIETFLNNNPTIVWTTSNDFRISSAIYLIHDLIYVESSMCLMHNYYLNYDRWINARDTQPALFDSGQCETGMSVW